MSTDRSPACEEAQQLLYNYQRIWDFSDYNVKADRGQFWMRVEAFATHVGTVILHRYYEEFALIGWEVYIPLVKSNKVLDTIESLKKLLEKP